MTLIRWTPSTPRAFVNIDGEMNRMFDGLLSRVPSSSNAPAPILPPVDLEETPDEFVLKVDLPGMTAKDVKVVVTGDTLTIRGERTHEANQKSAATHRRERIHGVFERSFTLGARLNSDRVQASYRDGVLEVRVPKVEEAKMREIEIQVG